MFIYWYFKIFVIGHANFNLSPTSVITILSVIGFHHIFLLQITAIVRQTVNICVTHTLYILYTLLTVFMRNTLEVSLIDSLFIFTSVIVGNGLLKKVLSAPLGPVKLPPATHHEISSSVVTDHHRCCPSPRRRPRRRRRGEHAAPVPSCVMLLQPLLLLLPEWGSDERTAAVVQGRVPVVLPLTAVGCGRQLPLRRRAHNQLVLPLSSQPRRTDSLVHIGLIVGTVRDVAAAALGRAHVILIHDEEDDGDEDEDDGDEDADGDAHVLCLPPGVEQHQLVLRYSGGHDTVGQLELRLRHPHQLVQLAGIVGLFLLYLILLLRCFSCRNQCTWKSRTKLFSSTENSSFLEAKENLHYPSIIVLGDNFAKNIISNLKNCLWMFWNHSTLYTHCMSGR